MSTFATVVGLAAAICTTGANLPQLKKAWTSGQTDDISKNMLLVLGSGLALWVAYGVLKEDRHYFSQRHQPHAHWRPLVFEDDAESPLSDAIIGSTSSSHGSERALTNARRRGAD